MNKKRIFTVVMIMLILFASLSLVFASVGPMGNEAFFETYLSLPEVQGIPIAGNIGGDGTLGGG